jgi:hypothetical protein
MAFEALGRRRGRDYSKGAHCGKLVRFNNLQHLLSENISAAGNT